jgi:hypothetical protein
MPENIRYQCGNPKAIESKHRHIDTRWEFGREGVSVYCRECKRWRTLFETGYDPADGLLLNAWPGPEPGTFEYQMDKLRRQVRELGLAIVDASGLERLVEWLEGGLRRLEKWLERKC